MILRISLLALVTFPLSTICSAQGPTVEQEQTVLKGLDRAFEEALAAVDQDCSGYTTGSFRDNLKSAPILGDDQGHRRYFRMAKGTGRGRNRATCRRKKPSDGLPHENAHGEYDTSMSTWEIVVYPANIMHTTKGGATRELWEASEDFVFGEMAGTFYHEMIHKCMGHSALVYGPTYDYLVKGKYSCDHFVMDRIVYGQVCEWVFRDRAEVGSYDPHTDPQNVEKDKLLEKIRGMCQYLKSIRKKWSLDKARRIAGQCLCSPDVRHHWSEVYTGYGQSGGGYTEGCNCGLVFPAAGGSIDYPEPGSPNVPPIPDVTDCGPAHPAQAPHPYTTIHFPDPFGFPIDELFPLRPQCQ